MKQITGFILFICCSVQIAAQTDTLKKFTNGNILLRQQQNTRLMSPAGAELGSWTSLEQNIKRWGRSLSVVKRTDSLGKKKKGVFDQQNGVFVIPVELDQLSRIDDIKGYYQTRIGNQFGFYVASTGKVLSPVFNYTGRHFRTMWFVACSLTTGFVFDEQLNPIDTIPGMSSVRTRIITDRNKWMVAVMPKGEGVVDTINHLLYNQAWTQIITIYGPVLVVKTGKGIGLHNVETGKLVKPYKYTHYMTDLAEANMYLSKGNQWVVLDKQGRLTLEFKADSVKLSSNHYADGFYFKLAGLWGLMNRKGQVIQKPVWKKVTEQYFSTTDLLFPNGRVEKADWIFSDVNGEYLLTGLKIITSVAGQDRNADFQAEVPKELPTLTNLPDAPGPVRHELDQDKLFVKMEIDPTFSSLGESEKTILRQRIDAYKKEQNIKKTGKVEVKLVVEKDGKISSTTIVSSADPLLTDATKTLLNTITGWRAGIQNGRVVRGEKTLVFEW
ncbi:MAG: energy transducer TonB [Sphingobacteriales bacterium]|nr:energy transducer TonB [Sphingobacteriales bacterium]